MSKARRAGLGSSFEDFLKGTGDYDAVNNAALKRVLAWHLEQQRAAQGVSKVELAERLNTSRSQLNRLLDPDNDDVPLSALKRAAAALGRSVKRELGDELVVAKPKLRTATHPGNWGMIQPFRRGRVGRQEIAVSGPCASRKSRGLLSPRRGSGEGRRQASARRRRSTTGRV
jgi:antitoxin HicB